MLFGSQCVPIVVEYRKTGSSSRFKLGWRFSRGTYLGAVDEPIPQQFLKPSRCAPETAESRVCKGLTGSYYSNPSFGGSSISRVDSVLLFSWDNVAPLTVFPESPSSTFPVDYFSVSWSGFLAPPHASGVETYTFASIADDSVKVWIDGVLVVNGANGDAGPIASVSLDASQKYSIRVDLTETYGRSQISLAYRTSSQTYFTPLAAYNLQQTRDCSVPAAVPPCSGLYAEAWSTNEYQQGMPADSFVSNSANIVWKYSTPANDAATNGLFSTRVSGCLRNPSPTPGDVSVALNIRSSGPIRVWIGDERILTAWDAQSVDFTLQVFIGTGRCRPIVVETRQRDRQFSLRWSYNAGSSSAVQEDIPLRYLEPTRCAAYFPNDVSLRQCKGLRANYFPDRSAQVLPHTILNSQINFWWDNSRPLVADYANNAFSNVRDNFAIEWRGFLIPKHASGTQNYQFSVRNDDAVRIKIGGDDTSYGVDQQGASPTRLTFFNRFVPMTAGVPVPISVSYTGYSGEEDIALFWNTVDPVGDWEVVPIHNLQMSANCDGSLPATPSPTCSGLYGEYFGNTFLEGVPMFNRIDQKMNDPTVYLLGENNAVRWSGCLRNPDSENQQSNVQLFFEFDGGMQAWVGPELAINKLFGESTAQLSINVQNERCVPVVLQYRNDGGYGTFKIRAQVSTARGISSEIGNFDPALFQPPRCTADPNYDCKGLSAYVWSPYNSYAQPVPDSLPPSQAFRSTDVLFARHAQSDGSWLSGGYLNYYVVRWVGYLVPPFASGSYRFRIGGWVDDGVRIRIGESRQSALPESSWNGGPARYSPTFDVTLTAGDPLRIEIEYAQEAGSSILTLHWEQLDGSPTKLVGPIPMSAFIADPTAQRCRVF